MNDRRDVGALLPGLGGALRYYLLTYALSWSIWAILIFVPGTADWAPLIIILGAYGPLLASLMLSRLSGGPGAARRWMRGVMGVRGRLRWLMLGGLVLPAAIALIHLLLYRLLVGAVSLSADPPWYWAVSAAPLNVLLVFWLGSAVEEFGWQGFAFPRLSQTFSPLSAGILHGFLWATWHLPLYLTGAWRGEYQEVWLLFAITLTLSPVMAWLTKSAGGSVIPAVLLHAATNHYSSLFTETLAYPVFTEPLIASFTEIKVALYLAAALTLIWATRGRLGYTAGPGGNKAAHHAGAMSSVVSEV